MDMKNAIWVTPQPPNPSAEDEIPFVQPYVPLVKPIDQEPLLVQPLEPVSILRSIFHGIGLVFECLFGIATLIIGLAVLAAIPIAQFLTFGYLLEVGGRMGRTGRLRDGFVGVRKAARVGSSVLGTYLMLLPLWLVSSLATDAQLLDPDGPIAKRWRIGLTLLTIPMVIHIVSAWSRGGKLRYFFWPFNFFWLMRRLWRGGYYSEARDAVWDFTASLRLPYFFWLGFRGFVGSLLWLAIPVTLLALGNKAGPLFGLLRPEISNPKSATSLVDLGYGIGLACGLGGMFTLAIVLIYLPFLQIHFASVGRLRAFLDLESVQQRFRRAPWMFAFAFFISLLFALPLYLLKIEMVPRQAGWLVSLFFILSIYPARFLAGWAFARAGRREAPRHWFFRQTGRLSMLPILAVYILILFFSQYTSWEGVWSLYAQHAFLLPVPFMSM